MTRRRVAAVLVAATVSLLTVPQAAHAHPPVVVLTSPLDSTYESMPRATGDARHIPSGVAVKQVELALSDRTSRGGFGFTCAVPHPVRIAGNGTNHLTFDQPLPTLACNGEYTLRATATTESRDMPAPHGEEQGDAYAHFVVAVAPVTPTGLRALVDDGRGTVTVRWDANPEADIIAYELERSHDGGDFRSVGESDEPEFVDDWFPFDGDYTYRVKAVRLVRVTHDEIEDEQVVQVTESAFSSTASVEMAATPTTSTTDATDGSGGDVEEEGGGDGTASGGTTSRHQSGRATTPTTRRQVYLGQEEGFRGELDYGVEPTTPPPPDDPVVQEEVAAPPGSVVARLPDDGGVDPSEMLLPVAGGLVLLVGALQMRYLLRQASRPSSLAAREPSE